MDRPFGKNDVLLITVLIISALFILFFSRFFRKEGSALEIVVTQNGEEILREDICREKEILIENPQGGMNRICIRKDENGTFAIVCAEADCPEQLCVRKGVVTLPDDPIVCLPHRLTVRIVQKIN